MANIENVKRLLKRIVAKVLSHTIYISARDFDGEEVDEVYAPANFTISNGREVIHDFQELPMADFNDRYYSGTNPLMRHPDTYENETITEKLELTVAVSLVLTNGDEVLWSCDRGRNDLEFYVVDNDDLGNITKVLQSVLNPIWGEECFDLMDWILTEYGSYS